MKTYLLEREQIISLPVEETYQFFSDAFNLEKITPGFLNFRILTPAPIRMEAGALIEYRLSLFGIPFKWRTLIEEWDVNRKFVDTQIKGPYALWHHTHTFEPLGPRRTLMRDVVRYRIPLGPLGMLAHWLLVEKMLGIIFDYRYRETDRLLNGNPGAVDHEAPKLARAIVSGD